MEIFLKVIVVSLTVTGTSCSIDGLSYMDPINQRFLQNDARRKEIENGCHPLYWYPREVPEHCKQKFIPPSGKKDDLTTPSPIRVPIPVPSQPVPVPYPAPFIPPPIPMPYPAPPYPVPPYPMLPPPPPPPPPMYGMPYGMPIMPPGTVMPGAGMPLPAMAPFPGMFPAQYPPPPAALRPQAGLVPAIHGLVSSDGGINIMPFTDAYSTMLEKHKHKMIKQHMEYAEKKYGNHKKYDRSKKRRKSRRW